MMSLLQHHRFCTVLEFVTGNDLDFLLKQNKLIPEKEVKINTWCIAIFKFNLGSQHYSPNDERIEIHE